MHALDVLSVQLSDVPPNACRDEYLKKWLHVAERAGFVVDLVEFVKLVGIDARFTFGVVVCDGRQVVVYHDQVNRLVRARLLLWHEWVHPSDFYPKERDVQTTSS